MHLFMIVFLFYNGATAFYTVNLFRWRGERLLVQRTVQFQQLIHEMS